MKKQNKRTTITRKLTSSMITLVVLILLVVISVSIIMMRQKVSKLSDQIMDKESDAYQNEMEDWVNQIMSPFTYVQDILKRMGYQDDKEVKKYLSTTLTVNENVTGGAYIANENNRFINPSGWIPGNDFSVKDTVWYQLGIESDSFQFSEPYTSEKNGDIVISAAAKMDTSTVMALDISLSKLSEKVKEMNILNNGYAFLIDDKSGSVIGHQNSEYDGKKVSDIGDSFIEDAYDIVHSDTDSTHVIKDNGSKYLVKCSAISGTNWYLVICADYSTVYKDLTVLQTIFAVIAFISIIGGSIVIGLRIKQVMKPIPALTNVIKDLGKGDFSKDVKVIGNDEITIMSEQLNGMIGQVRGTISELSMISDDLQLRSDDCVNASNQMNNTTLSQTEAMKQLKETVNELAKSTEEIALNATNLSNAVSGVNADVDEASSYIEHAAKVSEQGKEDIKDVLLNMENINVVMNQLETMVKDVDNSMNEINSITDIIGDIASRTNLLALNASIEAARAGEAGNGFAVVAAEIGTLASSSTDSVGKIAKLINNISEAVSVVAKKTEESVADIANSKTLVETTQKTFLQIDERVSGTERIIHNIKEKTSDVDGVSTDMASITEEQSASTEEILASLENIYEQSVKLSDASKEVKVTSEHLEDAARNITKQMDYFNIK